MDSPIVINWMSPLSFLGVLGVNFKLYSFFFYENFLSKQNSPRWDAAFCGVTWGYAVCLCPIKRTPGLYELISVNHEYQLFILSSLIKYSELIFITFSRYVWYLPFYVRVDGKLISPNLLPAIDWNQFSQDLGILSAGGVRYQIMYGLNGVDPGSLFAIYVREKVAVSSYKEIEAALETAWRRQHTGTH